MKRLWAGLALLAIVVCVPMWTGCDGGGGGGDGIGGTWTGSWSNRTWTFQFRDGGQVDWTGRSQMETNDVISGTSEYTYNSDTRAVEASQVDSYYWIKATIDGDRMDGGWYYGPDALRYPVVLVR